MVKVCVHLCAWWFTDDKNCPVIERRAKMLQKCGCCTHYKVLIFNVMTYKVLGAKWKDDAPKKKICCGVSCSTMMHKGNTKVKSENVFAVCKGVRMRKRVRNSFSRDEAGTCGTYVHTIRFENSYITKVCKSRNLY